MLTKQINITEKVNNGDGTQTMIAELNVYKDDEFVWQDSRTEFTFADTMTDEQIITHLTNNDYAFYFTWL